MDKHFVLPDGSAWKTLPFQRGIADAMSDLEIETVTVLKSARIGFTQLLVGYIDYRIALDPCGILVSQPAQEDAEGFSKEDFAPSLERVEPVRDRIGDRRARDSGNTILHKLFPGGFIRIGGAHTGRTYRRITVDVVAWDEVDAYPISAGDEGDQIELGRKRAHTAAFPKFILGSSPKLSVNSRIFKSWDQSDQRDFFVPCPHCDHGQRLRWGGRDADYGIKWPVGKPEDAFYLCENCHCEIEHHEKNAMVARGEYRIGRPEVKNHAGFRIWAAYSPFPAAAWGTLAAEFLRVKGDPPRLQVFVNTVLGEAYDAPSEVVPATVLMARREECRKQNCYALRPGADPESDDRLVPKPVLVITAGVDVQGDRLEAQIEGYGLGEECWKLGYYVLDGDPTGTAVWDDLWDLICRPLPMERGGVDYVRATCVDSGFLAQHVYDFCRPRWRMPTPDGRRAYMFATKGVSGSGTIWPREPTRSSRGRVLLYPIMVDTAKDTISARFHKVAEPGPAYTHFPDSPMFGDRYFEQLESEKATLGTDRRGFPTRTWRLKSEGRRNESWDTAVLCYAAFTGLKSLGPGLDLEVEAKRVAVFEPPPDSGGTTSAAMPVVTRPRRSRRRWKPADL